MKSTDLRIGNNIHNGVVISLDSTYATLAGHYNLSGMTSIEHSKLIPTPLTEEWFEKFGLIDKTEIQHNKYPFGKYKDTSSFGGIAINYENNGIQIMPKKEIKYVHELQNLYFALTGEELK